MDVCVYGVGNSGIPERGVLVNVLRDHFSRLCQRRDGCMIRLINEIIDHLMGLIIKRFDTLSCCSAPPLWSHHSSLFFSLSLSVSETHKHQCKL